MWRREQKRNIIREKSNFYDDQYHIHSPKKPLVFFRLSLFGLHVSQQAKSEKGFISLKNTGFGYTHYTMSSWQSESDVKQFARSGAHLNAMKSAAQISTEVRIFTFQGEKMPDWKEAKQLVLQKGKVFSYS